MQIHSAQVDLPQTTIMNTWQEIVDILANIINIPAGLIMRVNDPEIEVFVSSNGEGNPYSPGDKEKLWGSGLYCETVIKTKEKLHVPNALVDEHWNYNPDIKLNMISYLGYPILYPDGKPFGTICVLDNKENAYSDYFDLLVQKFRDLVQSDIALQYMNEALNDENKQLLDYISELKTLRGIVPICSICKSIQDEQGNWNPVEKYLVNHPKADFSHGLCSRCAKKHYSEFDLFDE